MKHGILISKSPSGKVNIGDYIQSLAAKQFFPAACDYVDREALGSYSGPPIKMILNSWFMHNPESWPPSDKIHPLLLSMHFAKRMARRVVDENGLAFLKKHEPVGCRDLSTQEILTAAGVQCYFSGCLTTTLGETYKREAPKDTVYIVDPFVSLRVMKAVRKTPSLLAKAVSKGGVFNIRSKVLDMILRRVGTGGGIQYEKHSFTPGAGMSEDSLFERAHGLLQKYARARLVITSRIHCALPCLGMGTPVVLVDDTAMMPGGTARFNGIADLFNAIKIDDKLNISANFDLGKLERLDDDFNPRRHVPLADALKKRCREFVAAGNG